MIRVVLPAHLRTLARVSGEVELTLGGSVTAGAIVDEIEARYPALRGTIRDAASKKRRPYIRYFACERDLSHDSPDEPLPEEVSAGKEPFRIVGAIAGG